MFKQFFTNGFDRLSSTRLVLVLGALPLTWAIIGLLIYVSVKTTAIAAVPASVAALLGTLLAHSALNKASESFGRGTKDSPDPPVDDQ